MGNSWKLILPSVDYFVWGEGGQLDLQIVMGRLSRFQLVVHLGAIEQDCHLNLWGQIKSKKGASDRQGCIRLLNLVL